MDNKIDINALRKAVEKSGMTQQQIADATEIGQSMISLFLNGKRGLSYFSYVSICKAIGEDPKNFLTEYGKKVLTTEL